MAWVLPSRCPQVDLRDIENVDFKGAKRGSLGTDTFDNDTACDFAAEVAEMAT